jgi:hypothetical protein
VGLVAGLGAGLASAAAGATDPARDWGTLYDARLVEVVDGTPEVAVELYAELVQDRPPTDVLYAEIMFWLGRAQLELDRSDAAVATLGAAVTDPVLRDGALALLEEAALRDHRIDAIPVAWNFEHGGFPGVRGAGSGGRGELAVKRVGERVVLSWGTTVRPGEPDRISLRFGDRVPVREFRLSLRPVEFPAVIRVVAIDGDGLRWVTEPWALGNEDWSERVVGPGQLSIPGVLSPRRIDRITALQIEDLTGERTSARGENTILIDDVVVR